ncbi:ABC transporter substrate-binding protein [Psychrobacillus soli]|uniref:Solute-binding protein family 5 domain-containing protein n=1 Tax=Psychrobacillus soli TaxID=1543965 RepID=A0A544SWQ7_9BACI|nr:ABC transporter substrate-binding protein [Psychrobacillus soli]TQR09650.1 hypothetical protein FG383_15755 [Psychrobacillus soli]
MKHGKKLLLTVLIAFALILSACTASTAGEEKESDGNVKDGLLESESVVIGVAAEPTTLMGSTQPAAPTYSIIHNIYDNLIEYDGKGTFLPRLAIEWKSIDELTWEFKLREGVTFHNGAPFNAESVKYTVEYLMNPDNKSLYSGRWTDLIKEIKIIDEHTIQFITNKPKANFLHLVYTDINPLEPGYVEKVGIEEAASNPIGTGPYKFKEWKVGESISFVANEDFWEGEPETKELTVKFIPEFSSRLSALLSGDVELIRSVPTDSIDRVEQDQNTKIISTMSGKNAFIALNSSKEGPLQNVKVRQALNHAIDVDLLIKNVMNGHAQKLTSTLTPFNVSYLAVDEYEYDPEKAIKLLAEAGYKPEDLNLTFDTTNGYFPMDTQVVQAIAGELEKLGIKINVVQNETGVFLQKATSKGMGDMYFITSAASTEGESFYSFYFSTTGAYTYINDQKLLEENVEAFKIFDPVQRQKAMDGIQQRLRNEAVSIPLWTGEDIWGAADNISFEPKYSEVVDFYSIKRSK